MNEKIREQIERAKTQTIGVEVEMNNITRNKAAKIAAEGGKKFNKLETKCGLVDGEFNDADALKIIASLPSREVLIAKMLGSMLAPISKLAYVLNAIAEKQEAQA